MELGKRGEGSGKRGWRCVTRGIAARVQRTRHALPDPRHAVYARVETGNASFVGYLLAPRPLTLLSILTVSVHRQTLGVSSPLLSFLLSFFASRRNDAERDYIYAEHGEIALRETERNDFDLPVTSNPEESAWFGEFLDATRNSRIFGKTLLFLSYRYSGSSSANVHDASFHFFIHRVNGLFTVRSNAIRSSLFSRRLLKTIDLSLDRAHVEQR